MRVFELVLDKKNHSFKNIKCIVLYVDLQTRMCINRFVHFLQKRIGLSLLFVNSACKIFVPLI